ncbi:MAG TPA: BLUF domain-containing protein [Roseiflexaceae bacterium]|nr:BLUF domain-containing protein [Roseiflexaceae bacterium]
MNLFQLVYASRPFGFDDAMLNGILMSARANNTRDDITGALICRADIYLQLLEGPQRAIEAAYSRIARDDRHLDIHRRFCAPATERLFPQWAMRDDPARSWMWTPEEVAAGAAARATREQLLAVFARVAAEPADT